MNSGSTVITEQRGNGALLVTLNRPEKLNALDTVLRSGLLRVLASADQDPEVRVLVLTGAGQKSFVAGADISEFEGRSPVDQYRVMSDPTIYEAIERSRKPIIAAINGFCLGGGMELALACDIRIASASARFGQPEVNLGIIPGGGGTQRLPRVVGMGAALRMILTGDLIDATEALRVGLVEEVVAAEDLLGRALSIAEMIASRSPVAVMAAREATRAAMSMSLADGLRLERSLFQLCFSSDDKREGVAAFLEKRRPDFPGR